jgi:hypothetical protein
MPRDVGSAAGFHLPPENISKAVDMKFNSELRVEPRVDPAEGTPKGLANQDSKDKITCLNPSVPSVPSVADQSSSITLGEIRS